MKNIHVLKTPNPSRLHEFGGIWVSHKEPTESFRNYNIYITNDEEIKVGDYVVQINFEKGNTQVIKCETEFQTEIANDKDGSYTKNKIILTTDQDLINCFCTCCGVQAIDDEFLEWFVKNPSCEEVETMIEYKDGYGNWYKYDKEFWDKHSNKPKFGTRYKIIMPQEEPKQINQMSECYFFPSNTTSSTTICDNCGKEKFLHTIGEGIKVSKSIIITKEEPKQETIEEAAISYNEKEVFDLLWKFRSELLPHGQIVDYQLHKFFEQFKKKTQ
jgi:hypothetical protein